MRVAILGFALPQQRFDEVAASDDSMPTQTQRFGLSLVQALRSVGCEVLAISAAPATSYPHNRHLVFPPRTGELAGSAFLELGFVNVNVVKHLTRLGSAVMRGLPAMRRWQAQILLIHGVHSPFIVVGLLARRLLRTPVVVAMTDPPSTPHGFDNTASLLFKRIDRRLILKLLSRCDGVIALTLDLANDFAPGVPCIVMEGIAPGLVNHDTQRLVGRKPDRPTVVYAGGVSDEYGVGLLLEAHRLGQGSFDLTIFGKGPLVDSVTLASRERAGLTYGGVVTADRLAQAYSDADLLVNPRPTHRSFVRYSFPSKLMEYLESGTPVISTRLPGIPDSYWDYLIPTVDTPEAILATIVQAGRSTEAVRLGQDGKVFIKESKSRRAQGSAMASFLASMVNQLGRDRSTDQ